MRRLFITTAAAALFFAGGVANAHPKLVSASPAANAAVATPEKISLQFSEKLVPAFSKAELIMAAMPGMAAVGSDGRTLTIIPKQRLPRGRYNVDWQVVSGDTHKITGSYTFTVK